MYSKIKTLFKAKNEHRNNNEAITKFNHLLNVAEQIASQNPRALPDFVNSILRPLQAETNLAVAEKGQDAVPSIDPVFLFGQFIHGYLWEHPEFKGSLLNNSNFIIRLDYHLVFSWPWSLSRYIQNISSIGKRKSIEQKDPWTQDANHDVSVWLPWGLCFVDGGNHSIMTGIASSEGQIQPNSVRDYAYLLDNLYTDGFYWYDSITRQQIDKVNDYRFAAVFEIGRLMRKHKCGADLFMIQ
ncbi:DUF6710 family protein [Photobacterium piscicola]|uniref:DUF6710 family protein n=1 Tax=Photobacterium piscicola TaxID=1378299 RepID=UPI003735738F